MEEVLMEERRKQTVMPRTSLPKDTPSTYAVVFWVAFAVSTLLVGGQIAFILGLTPIVLGIVERSGAHIPRALVYARSLGPIGMFVLLAAGDALVFAAFALLARKYWVGLLFVPPILYLAGAMGALWVYAAEVMLPR